MISNTPGYAGQVLGWRWDWIDVNDRKPSCESYVLAYNADEYLAYDVVKYCGGQWTNNAFHEMKDIKYWMPLPEPPVKYINNEEE